MAMICEVCGIKTDRDHMTELGDFLCYDCEENHVMDILGSWIKKRQDEKPRHINPNVVKTRPDEQIIFPDDKFSIDREVELTLEEYKCIKRLLACVGLFAEHGGKPEHSLDEHERWLLHEAHKHANSQLSLLMQLSDKFSDYEQWLESLLHTEKDGE